MTIQGFVFSDETSELGDAEFSVACAHLDAVEQAIRERDDLIAKRPDAAPVLAPDEGWHPDSQPSFQLDGSTRNAQTSYELLARRDKDIVRKMRLYSQAFTGYQLATLDMASNRPWVSEKLPEALDDFLRLCAGPPDPWVFKYVSVAGALPEELRAAPPRKFGELGWLIDGVIVNYDTYSYLERLCLLYENGIIQHFQEKIDAGEQPCVVEIGGGYGGLAYQLMTYFGNALRYIIIDLPESLAFSAIYCNVLFPTLSHRFVSGTSPFTLSDEPGFTYVPNTIYRSLERNGADVDLVINTLSLSEMSDAQIEDYCIGIEAMIGTSGLFFEQNHQSNHEGPGGIVIRHFKNLRHCTSQLLPDDFAVVRGQSNIWVNREYLRS